MARKILLADDSVTAQNMGRKILADAGYEVITVNNGSAALKKIGEARPDLIVLDVYMPGYSGLEVCQRLKEVGDTSRIPILLTVGKLEPFKPEEAKRVRADAFIVKPFEASDLLSALSKLEDKVVPRADSSKPGRFARATAAIEEGRFDRTMTVEEDDSGWKNRISFPKKKEKPRDEEIDTGEIYNAVNKDLRTVVEPKLEPVPAAPVEARQTQEAHVNVGSLVPEGLPKDVTPEEMRALAAAAAQIKGKVVEDNPAASEAEAAVRTPSAAEAQSANFEAAKTARVQPARVQPANVESKQESLPAEAIVVPAVALNATAATLAAQQPPEKAEEKKPEHKSGPAEVMAAIAGLETEWVSLPAVGLGNGPLGGNDNDKDKDSAPPGTVAVVAATDSRAAASRWTAVSVALGPDEAAISLEQEMQKAYAAFAAAEGGHTVASTYETSEVVAQSTAADATAAIPATSAPEAVQPLAAVSEAATEALSAAVKELEAVAAGYEAERKDAWPKPANDKSHKDEALKSPAAAPEPEPKIEEKIEAGAEQNVEPIAEDSEIAEKDLEPAKFAEAAPVEAVALQIAPEEMTEKISEKSEKPVPVTEIPQAGAGEEVPVEKSTSDRPSTEPLPVFTPWSAGGTDDMAKRESETAAAWASWRKIRETGGAKPAPPAEESVKEAEDPVPQHKAAMAVAAGAERKPEEATSSIDPEPEIATIVDSVLADLRPKIVEEIARKLGKKR